MKQTFTLNGVTASSHFGSGLAAKDARCKLRKTSGPQCLWGFGNGGSGIVDLRAHWQQAPRWAGPRFLELSKQRSVPGRRECLPQPDVLLCL